MPSLRQILVVSTAISLASLLGCGGKETGKDKTAIESPHLEAAIPLRSHALLTQDLSVQHCS